MLKLHKDTDVTLADSVFSQVKRDGRVLIEDMYRYYQYLSKQRDVEPMSFEAYSDALARALKEDELLIDYVYEFNSCKILF